MSRDWLLGVDIGTGSVNEPALTPYGRHDLGLCTQAKSVWADLS